MGFNLTIKNKVLEKQNLRCACCGRLITLTAKRLRDWHKENGLPYPIPKCYPSQAKFHHKLWRSRGGSDTVSNCVALCGDCHAHKAHKPWNKA